MKHLFKTVFAALLLAGLPAPVRAGSGGGGVGINLASPVDWSTAQPFLDLMKTSRPWIGHGADEWEVMNWEEMAAQGVFDDHGWPKVIPPGVSSVGTLMLTDLPEDTAGVAGRYLLRWEGSGEVEVGLGAQNVDYGAHSARFDFAPGNGPVHVVIRTTDPEGTGDHVRNMTLVREDRVALHAEGAVFNPDWLALIDGFEVLRFMDWMETNDSTLAHWEDRPEPGDVSYRLNGVPVEIMVRLANELGAEPWFTMPHLADDDFVRRFAETVRDGLDPDLRAWVEFSNEVWNWIFDQAHWADAVAKRTWRRDPRWIQIYAGRASEVADIWAEVFGAGADARLMRVIATQTGWMGLEQEILNAGRWVSKGKGRSAPGLHFDAYAVTGYFGGHLAQGDRVGPLRVWIAESRAAAEAEADRQGLTGAARADYIEAHRFDAAVARAAAHLAGADGPAKGVHDLPHLVDTLFPYHANIAREWDLELVAYEGGSHVVGGGEARDDDALTEFLVHFNYSPEMAELYRQMFEGWKAAGGGVFAAYSDVARPGRYGSWGHLRHLGDSNPRWDALVAARDGRR
ncbi:MAG: hypothetical protein CSA74_09510 [Rhodobacterales bacterium]|nr:MAG: hypothetical protein CSA74_09510 [Rhodobacterales bacterium]